MTTNRWWKTKSPISLHLLSLLLLLLVWHKSSSISSPEELLSLRGGADWGVMARGVVRRELLDIIDGFRDTPTEPKQEVYHKSY